MLIYLLSILFFLSFSLINESYFVNKKFKDTLTYSCLFILIIQFGLRWETGTDWEPYFNHFNSFAGLTSIILSDFEYGYGLFEFTISYFTNNYSILLIIHSIIFYLLVITSFKKYSPNIFLTLMLFYTAFMGVVGSNRQLLAVAVCLYSIEFILKKRPLFFTLLIIVATSFHSTAFVFIFCYFLNFNIKNISFLTLIIFSIIIGRTELPLLIINRISGLFGDLLSFKLNFYIQNSSEAMLEKSLTFIGFVKRMLFLACFYYTKNKLNLKFKYYNLLFNIYLMGLIIYFLFSNSLLIFVNRGSLYFNIMEPLLLTLQLYVFKDRRIRILCVISLFILSIGLFFQSISAYTDLFIPYKGLFFNSDFVRELY